jgi:Fur family ferric uptake transcriptional regulator
MDPSALPKNSTLSEPKPAQRNTRQKSAIRQAFLATGRPMSPQEVLDSASVSIEGLGLATVYRNIRNLVEEGWLTAVGIPGEAPRYEVAGKEHHHHFHCQTCDRVFEIPGCFLVQRPALPKGFVANSHEIVIYGVCAHCAEKPAKNAGAKATGPRAVKLRSTS